MQKVEVSTGKQAAEEGEGKTDHGRRGQDEEEDDSPEDCETSSKPESNQKGESQL